VGGGIGVAAPPGHVAGHAAGPTPNPAAPGQPKAPGSTPDSGRSTDNSGSQSDSSDQPGTAALTESAAESHTIGSGDTVVFWHTGGAVALFAHRYAELFSGR